MAAVAVLFAVTGSASLALTLTVLVMIPMPVDAVTTMVAWTLCPPARLPRPQVTTPPVCVQPGEADAKATPCGNVSVSRTPVASERELLVTVIV